MEIELIQTCGGCPEQYDAILNGQQVGYLRLRHGLFTVRCPSNDGDLVYEAVPAGDGIFEFEERDFYLNAALSAIVAWLEDQEDDDIVEGFVEVEEEQLIIDAYESDTDY